MTEDDRTMEFGSTLVAGITRALGGKRQGTTIALPKSFQIILSRNTGPLLHVPSLMEAKHCVYIFSI